MCPVSWILKLKLFQTFSIYKTVIILKKSLEYSLKCYRNLVASIVQQEYYVYFSHTHYAENKRIVKKMKIAKMSSRPGID